MPVRSETELYEPVKRFFEKMGYEVKGEVMNCDMVAIRESEEPVLVELKKTFNLPLVIQGIDRLRRSNRVYLATEQNRNGRAPHGLGWNDLTRLCRMLGLGLMVVRFYQRKSPVVEILCDPEPYTPRKNKKGAARLMTEFRERSGDYNTGGSTRRKLMTAYREKALLCGYFLQQHGPLSTRKLRQITGFKQVQSILYHNHYGWFRRTGLGIYELTPAGVLGLEEFAPALSDILSVRNLAFETAAAGASESVESPIVGTLR
ncbi:DUF2161 domain-containing phosphodiesterase [Gorillibacterium massiliense]|uniref:DUF2161 domain-containing phosphodiesterase n=1 Tax=Gorillibacterium massiliense TaxID=1280390 RepID=UPI0004B41AD7|nr:DUF2161 family putative PD-(D/E)XK-type phosphodiesterase [Gorillibacterium massiliense]